MSPDLCEMRNMQKKGKIKEDNKCDEGKNRGKEGM
jgi:hypothetical protein